MSTENGVAPVAQNDHTAKEIAALAEKYRKSEELADLVQLRDLRLQGGKKITQQTDSAWRRETETETPPNLFAPGSGELPEVDYRDLSAEAVQSAMYHHGALIVRNLFSSLQTQEFCKDIDTVMDAGQEYFVATKKDENVERSADSRSAFTPAPLNVDLNAAAFMGNCGAVATFLSPKVSHRLFERFDELGLRELLQAYFQDESCVSYYKSVLRRVEPLPNPADWHQDGAFMGKGIDSLNLWVALTDCGAGTNSPGMDLVPQRLNGIVPPGGNGAAFDWSVSAKTVSENFADVKIAQPHFGAGDAVFFDHFNLHVTSSSPKFTKPRYAIETWFFSKSRCALNQIPEYW